MVNRSGKFNSGCTRHVKILLNPDGSRQDDNTWTDSYSVVFGHEVKHSGTKTEKGVDAQLVADIIYHSARRNCEQIMLIANDADYCYALRRVRDFGCKTSLVALIQEPTDYLKGACDEYLFICEAIFANQLKRKGDTLGVLPSPKR